MDKISLKKLNRIGDHLLSNYVPNNFPGCSILVSHNLKEVYYFQTGLVDIKRKRKLERDSIFRIYSMTKPITSLGIMILLEKGKISISDEVEKYIPEWKDMSVYQSGNFDNLITETPKDKMTIKHLLMHMSGLTYDFEETSFVQKIYLKEGIKIARSKEKFTSDEYINKLSEIPLAFSPGDYFNYSISTDILGFIIERITNQTLDIFFKKLLTP